MGSIVGQFEQDLIIKESSSLIGQVRGNVTVCERVNLQLHGLVVGSLIRQGWKNGCCLEEGDVEIQAGK